MTTRDAASWGDPALRPVNAHGSKARVDTVAKSAYSDWRRQVGHGCYVNDVDWVEWRIGPAGMRLAAVIETSSYRSVPDHGDEVPHYCACALARFQRDAQYEVTSLVASRLGVPAYFVLVRHDCDEFWLCRLRDGAWRRMTQAQYRQWLMRL